VQVHVGGVAIPRADQVQPGPVAGDDPAELRLDRRVDQHPVYAGQAGCEADQGSVCRGPFRRVHAASVRGHQGAYLDAVQLGWQQRRLRLHVQPYVGIQPQHVAGVDAWHRAAARAGNVIHVDRRQPRSRRPHAERLQGGNGVGMAPVPAPAGADRLVARSGQGQLDRARDAAAAGAADDADGRGPRAGRLLRPGSAWVPQRQQDG